jgi:CheY-like chemotaxis protein
MGQTTPNSSATILCVDDLEDNLMVRKLMLETFGYHVLTATNPPEALQMLETERVDLVLLDFRFPGFEDGKSLAQRIRLKWPEIKLLMLSGFPDIPATARDSVDAFAVKGANPAVFRDTLESLIHPGEQRTPATDAQKQNMELRKKRQELLDDARRSKTRDIA